MCTPLRSAVWKHFFLENGSDDNYAVCNYCSQKISRGGLHGNRVSFTTSNMWNHMKRIHYFKMKTEDKNMKREIQIGINATDTDTATPSTSSTPNEANATSSSTVVVPGRESKVLVQPTLQVVIERGKLFDDNDSRALFLTKAIAEMMCTDMQPFSVVQHEGFMRLLHILQPRYRVPSRKHFSTTVIPNMYERLVLKVKFLLSNLQYISVTADLWSSAAMEDFISLTAHGINEDMQLTHYCLEVHPFEGANHSSALIAENIDSCLKKWEITDKVSYIITDNAANIVRAVDLLGKHSITCLAHSVQLVVNKVVNDIAPRKVIPMARRLVSHFHHSIAARKSLSASQKAMSRPEKTLIQDVPTRWDSTLMMLRRLYELRIPVQDVMPSLKIVGCDFSTSDWVLIAEVIKLLELFEEVTLQSSKESCTLADAIPLVVTLEVGLLKLDTISSLKPVVADISRALQSRFNPLQNSKPHVLATVVDPRYKCRLFPTRDVANQARLWLIEEMISCVSSSFGNSDGLPSTKSAVTATATSSTVSYGSTFMNLFQELIAKSEETAEGTKCKFTHATFWVLVIRRNLKEKNMNFTTV